MFPIANECTNASQLQTCLQWSSQCETLFSCFARTWNWSYEL